MKNMDDSMQQSGRQQSGAQPDNRQPEEIERDIQRTRDEVSSTIEAIQSKLTPGQMMDQAISYARHSLPADFGSNLGNSVRENPLPVALIGVGIAWLMASGQQGRGQAYGSSSRSARRPYDDSYEARYDPSFEAAYDSASARVYGAEGIEGVEGVMPDGGGQQQGMLHNAMDKASSAGQDAKSKISEGGRHMKERMSGAGQHMKETAGHMRHKASDLGQRSQEGYYRAKDWFGQLLEEQPLVLGALGVALGASLGASMPRTRREDELMGSTRDSLMEETKQRASEQAGKVQQAVGKAMDEARSDTRNDARSDTRSDTDRAANTGKAGGDSAKARTEEDGLIKVETKGRPNVMPDGAGTTGNSGQQSLH